MMTRLSRRLLLSLAILLSGCATQTLPGYQNTFQGYDIPQPLLNRITAKFREHGLATAAITRDNVGRVRLAGSYRDDDEVDDAFVIVQSIVGIKSTSPFYPQNVKLRRWDQEAGKALADAAARRSAAGAGPGVKRALVIGINTFVDPALTRIQGEDDARVVAAQLAKFGYRVTSLLGPQATKARIEQAVAQIERELGANDTLFIYVSSHGGLPVPSAGGSDERRMSIMAYDTGVGPGRTARDATDHQLLVQRTAVKDTLLQQLAQKPSRATRVVVDTCYSGEMLRGVPDDSTQFILRQNGGKPEREGVSLAAWSGAGPASKGIQVVGTDPPARVGAKSAATQKAQDAIRSRPAYTVITASSEGQLSYGPQANVGTFQARIDKERSLRGSYFTQTFAAWLEVHNGQVQPAFEQARSLTSDLVAKESQGRLQQTPRIFSTMNPAEDNLARF